MMAPTLVLEDGEPEVVLGSAGSNRIRSAIILTISQILDRACRAGPAVEAPRLHVEDGVVWVEPGIPVEELEAAGREVRPFRALNMFFGGVQAAERDAETGELSGGGDPRRGGTAVVV
jgi:gamma-glutamyltranspeptidase/glutathione hydrolase